MHTGRQYHYYWLEVLKFIDAKEPPDSNDGPHDATVTLGDVLRNVGDYGRAAFDPADVLLRLHNNGVISMTFDEVCRCHEIRNSERDRAWLKKHKPEGSDAKIDQRT